VDCSDAYPDSHGYLVSNETQLERPLPGHGAS